MARPRDEGFSLLEVLFAAFIAFFVLTALFGVLVASTNEGRIANADTVATNLAQLVVEQARAMPYGSVGTVGAPSNQPLGLLKSEEPTSYQNLSFTIRRTVEWVDDRTLSALGQGGHDYKKLTVQVSWVNGHTTPISAFIRDSATNLFVPPPAIEWKVAQVLTMNNAVIFTKEGPDGVRTRVWDRSSNYDGYTSDAVSLQASASVDSTGGTVARMEYWVGDTRIPGLQWGGAETTKVFPEQPWEVDLLQSEDASGNPLFHEGVNTVKVIAYSNTMSNAYGLLLLTVDNTPPNFDPGYMPFVGPANWNQDRYYGALGATWTVPLDGGQAPTSYDITVTAYPSMTSVSRYQSLGSSGTCTLGRGIPSGLTVTPFSPYTIALTPRSIRGRDGRPSSTSAWGISAPQLRGTLVNSSSNTSRIDYSYVLSLSPPNPSTLYTVLGGTSIVYQVYRIDSSTGYTYPGYGDLPDSAAAVGTPHPYADFQATPKNWFTTPGYWDSTADKCTYYYQVEALIMDGTSVVSRIRSNVIGASIPNPPKTWREPSPPAVPVP